MIRNPLPMMEENGVRVAAQSPFFSNPECTRTKPVTRYLLHLRHGLVMAADLKQFQRQRVSFNRTYLPPGLVSGGAEILMELYAGIRGQRERRCIEAMINHASVLDVTHDIGVKAGEYLKKYRSSHGVGAIDALIAATAESHSLNLATLNLKHFPMFKGLERPYQQTY